MGRYRFDTKDGYTEAIRLIAWDIKTALIKEDWEEIRDLYAEIDSLEAERDRQFPVVHTIKSPNDKSEN